MGQKTNPIIFRLGKTKTWDFKYTENKLTEFQIHNFKFVELETFIKNFFKVNNLLISDCKINHFDNKLDISIKYFVTQAILKKSKSSKKAKKIKSIYNHKSKLFKQTNIKKFLNVSENKKIKKYIRNINGEKNKALFNQYTIYLKMLKHQKTQKQKYNAFLEQFIESLNQFTRQKYLIFVTLKQLNQNTNKILKKQTFKLLKKNIVQLRRYKQQEFFNEGINIIFATINQKNSTILLTRFLAEQLKKLKRHNFFLRFIKTALILFNNTTQNINALKIKIKGRFNGAPRAKEKTILIRNVPVLTLNANINYKYDVAYTKNGTFGIKIWHIYSS